MCNCTTTLHRYAYICNGPILLQCVNCKLKPLHVQAPMHTHMIQSPMCLCIPAQVSRRMHKADLITEQRPELTHFFFFASMGIPGKMGILREINSTSTYTVGQFDSSHVALSHHLLFAFEIMNTSCVRPSLTSYSHVSTA